MQDVRDDTELTREERERLATQEIISWVDVPLVKEGVLTAVLCVTQDEPRAWTEAEIALVEQVAERTWSAVERARVEAALQASETRFRGFADMLWIVNADTRKLEYVSPAFEQTWGAPRETVLREHGPMDEIVFPQDRPVVRENLSRVLAGQHNVVEYRIVRPSDGLTRWIRDTGFPIRDDNGRVQYAAGIAQDITGPKLAEAEREAFVAAAAHDLKTPLTSLRGQAQLLLRRSRREHAISTERLESRLMQIDAAAERMAAVIDEMQDAAHLRSDRPLDLRLLPTDHLELARSAITNTRRDPSLPAARLESDESSLIGTWDHARLERVLGNLLGNAVKYSPDGGEITVRAWRETTGDGQACAVLSVQDHGIGIPSPDLPHLFQRFRRGGNVANIGGTGIGLAGARQIVEQHGGTLTAISEEREGSTFVMRLPLTSLRSTQPAAEAGDGV